MQNFRIKLPTNASLPKLVPLIVPLVVLMLSDSIIAYSVPIYAQNLFSNDFFTGLVISFSSLVGLVFDFLSKRLFGSKNFSFFIKFTFILLIIVSYSLGLSFINKYIFIFAMAIWGIYYETLAFSNFKYLKNFVNSNDYTFSWGFISMLRALIYGIGPLIATVLISKQLQLPAYLCGTFVLLAFFLYLALFNKESKAPAQATNTTESKQELKVWFMLFKKIYPIWVLNLTLVLIDSGFWTIGILMSENLGKASPLAKLIIPLYMLPAVIFSPLSQTISSKFGKKKTAIVTSFIGAFFLVFTGLAVNIELILLAIFAYSVFTSVAFPAICATFEDYVSRLGNFDTDLIGLEQSSGNFAYIIGPVLAGFIALHLTEQKVFLIFGLLLALISFLALIITPRKIKMPLSKLLKIS
ncbi:MAG: MFS transporter [Patescibacteria group bacterium]